MVGFNVTRMTVLTPERLEAFSKSDEPVARFVHAVVSFHRNVRGAQGLVVHDPLALGVAIDPSFIRTELLPVEVELRGELTRGQTVVDLRAEQTWKSEREVTTRVALEVDAERFLGFLVERLAR
jgi:inosine-uridine nucleoside N-ribohydrolase